MVSAKYIWVSTKNTFKSKGLRATLQSSRGYVGSRFFPVATDETARRFRLGQKLSKLFDNTVAYGPFKGLILSDTSWWGAADRGSMLLGLYEQEVLTTLTQLAVGRETLIDLGAADGYYAVGSVSSGLFTRSIAFEISPEGRTAIGDNAERNLVSDLVRVLGEAESDFLTELQAKYSLDLESTALLIDIEGAEFDLLSAELLERMSQAALIIEIHDFHIEDKARVSELLGNAARYFNTEWVTTGQRDLSTFPELTDWSDDDRWILCSESRPKRMKWLILTPK